MKGCKIGPTRFLGMIFYDKYRRSKIIWTEEGKEYIKSKRK